MQIFSYKMNHMVTRVENTVLYNWNLLREQNLNVLTEKKEREKMWSNGCVN